jgi:hypothetical protein
MDALVWPIAPKRGHVIAEDQSVNMAFLMQGFACGSRRSQQAEMSPFGPFSQFAAVQR